MPCKLCSRENPEEWEIRGKEYSFCPGCGFIQLSEKYFPDKEAEKARYLSHNNTKENKGYRSYLENFLESSFYPFIYKHSVVFDFGSGPQPVLQEILQSRGFSVHYYDPFFAPGRDWKMRKYDVITAVEVFEHLQDPLAEIQTLSSLLNPNGLIIIRTMLHNEEKQFFASWWYREDYTHVSFFSVRTIHAMAEGCGLSVLSLKNNCEIVLVKESSFTR